MPIIAPASAAEGRSSKIPHDCVDNPLQRDAHFSGRYVRPRHGLREQRRPNNLNPERPVRIV